MGKSEQLEIKPLTRYTGAVIRNFDLSQPMTPHRKQLLEEALYKYHVLFFHDQHLTTEQQRNFALEFGQIHVHPIFEHTGACPEVTVLEYGANIDPNKKPVSNKWHTDVSWSANPPIIGMLYANIIPKQGGGDTLWANMVEIYKHELSDQMKEFLSHLTAEHSMEEVFKPSSNTTREYIEKYNKAVADNPPVSHPIIREHPYTKEKCLYVNSNFTTKINELNQAESDVLLNYLFSLVNQRPEYICRWKWTENDVCIWDERTTQHYATIDYWPQHRRLYRCAIAEREN